MKTDTTLLPQAVVDQLQGEKLAFAVTTNADNEIYSTAISWLAAVNPHLIRFAVSPKSPLIRNVNERPRMQILFSIPEHTLAVTGTARVLPDPIPDMPFPMLCVELAIDRADDIMFYGGKVTSEPKYIKTYAADLSQKLDTAVYTALRKPV
ncbi:hypothetical protein EXW96_21680 [Paenibacillus sp. JMULE4]|uniref:pyridoxamine 5'-phosphate oxidase family protein n=1 Tax=Paenibacillus TaxID=44249 RepID=UPI0015768443|nr:pyridoxamine 5'-phosphate oxidase family protein [Paenibacillus sp. JMULE4]NTZ20062.1 hypothetical protein [Paenibacillus sp. JMULE4]